VSSVKKARLGLDLEQQVHDHRGLLLEGARHVQARMEMLDEVLEHLLRRRALEVGSEIVGCC